jgi:hypothetical protein
MPDRLARITETLRAGTEACPYIEFLSITASAGTVALTLTEIS